MPLRAKLIVLTLVLLTAALAVLGTASVLLLHTALLHDVDRQLGDGAPHGEFVIQHRGPDGGLRQEVRSSAHPGPTIPADPEWLAAQREQPVTVGGWRVLVGAPQPNGDVLVVAMDLGGVNRTIRLLATIEAIAGAVAAAGLAVVGVVAVRRSLRPLAELEYAAAAVVAGTIERVPVRRAVGTLATSLNTVLDATRAESEDRMRRFLTDASHELRTPLSVIRGLAEFWGRRSDDPVALATALHRVEDEATRMGVLVDGLLLLARLDRERPPRNEPVDLLALVSDAVRAAQLSAPARRIRLVVADAGYLVPGDPIRLRQVIDHLLANALIHTPHGTPVEVRLDAGNRYAVLEVADRGPGLTPEQATHVFDRFYRVDVARGRETGGSGLGLAIVAALVTAHGGVVEVDAAPGAGATFRVALPLARTPSSRPL
jgi:two-component system OmpR family sensor kinase